LYVNLYLSIFSLSITILLNDMYHKFFNKYIDETQLKQIKHDVLSPAFISNQFISCENNSQRFIEQIILYSNK